MLRFAGIQMKVSDDKLVNLRHASELVAEAVNSGAKLISLPECFNCPYGNQFFPKYAEQVPGGPSCETLRELAKEHKIFLIGGSIPEECNGNLYNSSLVFNPEGEMIAKHRKVHLFDIDIPNKIYFKESEVLTPGDKVTVFNVEGFKVGLGVCYDLEFPEMALLMRQKGAHVLVYPGAYDMTTGPPFFEVLTRSRAIDNQVYCASIAPATDPDAFYVSWGHSLVSSPYGRVLDSAEHNEKIIYCDMIMKDIEDMRAEIPSWSHKRSDIYQVKNLSVSETELLI